MKLTEIIRNLIGNFNDHASSTENPHGVTAEQVGLGNVDNTADADKPVSTAQKAVIESPEWIDVWAEGITPDVGGRYYFAELVEGKPGYTNGNGYKVVFSGMYGGYIITAPDTTELFSSPAVEPEDLTGASGLFIPEDASASGQPEAERTTKFPRELIEYYAGTLTP